MSDEVKMSIRQAHELFATSLNGEVWELLENPKRTADDDVRMLSAAYASFYHWLHVGTKAHLQRGQWLIARVHIALGRVDGAVYHSGLCMQLTQDFPNEMKDFDLAYAFESAARVYALSGNHAAAQEFYEKAKILGEKIANEEDKTIFQADLSDGNWFGAI